MTDERKIKLFDNLLGYVVEAVNDDTEVIRVLLRQGFESVEINEELCLGDSEQVIGLCTFPDEDEQFCKVFYVPKGWLVEILEILDNANERKGVDLERFIENYIWDETWFLYELAVKQGYMLYEEVQL